MALIQDLNSITGFNGSDIIVVDDGTETQTGTITQLTSYLSANLSIPTGIDDIAGLQAVLDGKAPLVHTHQISDITDLQTELNTKFDSTTAGVVNNVVIIGNTSVDVIGLINERVADITGVSPTDSRIPGNVTSGNFLQFASVDGTIGEVTANQFKSDLLLNNVDNTADLNKPISTATQTALDAKVSNTFFTSDKDTQDAAIALNTAKVSYTDASAVALNTAKITYPSSASTKLAGIESGADVTDTANVWSSLGISNSGSTTRYLTERGVFTAAEAELTLDEIGGKALPNTAPGDQQGFRFDAATDVWEYTTIPSLPAAPQADSEDRDYSLQIQDDGTQNWVEASGEVGGIFDRNRQVVDVDFGGTRSNVVSGGTGEVSRIFLRDDFNAGSILGIPFQFEYSSTSVYNSVSTVESIRFTGAAFDQFSSNQIFNIPLENQFTNTSGDSNEHILDEVFSNLDGVSTTLDGVDIAFGWDQTSRIGSIYGVSLSSGLSNFTSSIALITSSSFVISVTGSSSTYHNDGDTDITVSTYSYDPDTSDAIYSHTVDGGFSDNANTSTALTELGTAIAASHSNITWDGNVVSGSVLFGARTFVGSTGFDPVYDQPGSATLWGPQSWGLLSSTTIESDDSTSVSFSSSDTFSTFNNNHLVLNNTLSSGSENSFNRLGIVSGDTIRLVNEANTGSGVFEVGTITTTLDLPNASGDVNLYQLINGRDYTGTMGFSSSFLTNVDAAHLQLQPVFDASHIDIDLGTSNNIDSSFTITMNSGSNVDETITNFDPVTGSGLHSTYTVVDYSGTQITSFTSSVDASSESDVDQVAQIISNSINNNVETPIDFSSVYNAGDNELILTSEAGWTASTTWSITANHGATEVSGLIPNGDNLTTATTFDTGGGGAGEGQWYWREAQGTNTVVSPAEWSDLVSGNQIIIDTPALDDATTEALQDAVDISDSLFVRTDTGSAELEISGTSGASTNDYRFTIASVIRSYGTPGFSGGISLSDTASEETNASAKGDISIVVNPGTLEQINEISRIQIDESITFSDASQQTTAFDPTSFPSGTLASPPSGLVFGDIWEDTTDSTDNPILRIYKVQAT